MLKKTDKSKNKEEQPESNVSLFLDWCKKCGNCVAFCPSNALQLDKYGYPFLARPEKCKACHLCEKLCPDFAIGVADGGPQSKKGRTEKAKRSPGDIPGRSARPSYERLAPDPVNDEEENEDPKKSR
jgi:2-oxoglutarate ferredoxin oxidoreductase subunit delta